MIVIAIIGLLAAIAVPSYNGYMLKSRRVDGTAFLIEVASEQVRFYSEYNRYANTMSDLGYGTAATADSKEGHYTVTITTTANDSTYLLTAAPATGSPQLKDTACGTMALNSSQQKTVTGTSTAADCW
ncbi:UNVERIFIED_CONTAM: hypothetical protein GTU68_054854 [Idotea baltica]|nr:hypothetical protein [Idotea baltica]